MGNHNTTTELANDINSLRKLKRGESILTGEVVYKGKTDEKVFFIARKKLYQIIKKEYDFKKGVNYGYYKVLFSSTDGYHEEVMKWAIIQHYEDKSYVYDRVKRIDEYLERVGIDGDRQDDEVKFDKMITMFKQVPILLVVYLLEYCERKNGDNYYALDFNNERDIKKVKKEYRNELQKCSNQFCMRIVYLMQNLPSYIPEYCLEYEKRMKKINN